MTAYWFIRTKSTYEPAVPVVMSNQAEFNRNVSYAFSGLVGGYGRAADLVYRASGVAIADHILCDGSALSRLGFPELFAAIGETFGAGNGSTTFNIPTQAQLAATIATPPAVPEQTVEGGAVSSGTTVTDTTGTGGTSGGGVSSGGRPVDASGYEQEV